MINKLNTSYEELAYQIILEVTSWLKNKNIQQWEKPLPKSVFSKWISEGSCYGYFVARKINSYFCSKE